MAPLFVHLIISPNIDRFSNFVHCQNQEAVCNKTITIDPITPQVCRYTTLWNIRWRIQAGDATEQWRDHPNAASLLHYQWRSPASAGWLSWIVDVDRPFVEGPPKQHNRPDLSPSELALSTLIMQLVSVVADLSAMSDISQGSVVTYEVWWDL